MVPGLQLRYRVVKRASNFCSPLESQEDTKELLKGNIFIRESLILGISLNFCLKVEKQLLSLGC